MKKNIYYLIITLIAVVIAAMLGSKSAEQTSEKLPDKPQANALPTNGLVSPDTVADAARKAAEQVNNAAQSGTQTLDSTAIQGKSAIDAAVGSVTQSAAPANSVEPKLEVPPSEAR